MTATGWLRGSFKLARMTGAPSTVGKPDAFDPPDEELISQHTAVLTSRAADLTACSRSAASGRPPCVAGVPRPSRRCRCRPVFHAYRVPFTSGYAAGEIAAYGADVVVCEPAELRAEVVSHLRGVLKVHAAGKGPGQPRAWRDPS